MNELGQERFRKTGNGQPGVGGAASQGSSPVDVEGLRKYGGGMFLGLILEYLGWAGIQLFKAQVVASPLVNQIGGWAFYAGLILILVFTYHVSRSLRHRVPVRVGLAVINVFLVINLFLTGYLIYRAGKIMKGKA